MKTLVGMVLIYLASIAACIFALGMFGLQIYNSDMTRMRFLLDFLYTWKCGVGILICMGAGYALIKNDKR